MAFGFEDLGQWTFSTFQKYFDSFIDLAHSQHELMGFSKHTILYLLLYVVRRDCDGEKI